jgi:hypothetical protein
MATELVDSDHTSLLTTELAFFKAENSRLFEKLSMSRTEVMSLQSRLHQTAADNLRTQVGIQRHSGK